MAAGERLITKDTAAWDRPRCCASDFRLVPAPEGLDASGVTLDFERGIGRFAPVVSHIVARQDKVQI